MESSVALVGLAMAAVAMAGCAGQPQGDDNRLVPAGGPDAAQPYAADWWMPGCSDPAFVFAVSSAHAQDFLPEGYSPEPYLETNERLSGLPSTVGSQTAIVGKTMVLVVPHYCAEADVVHGDTTKRVKMDDFWVWVAVDEAHKDWGEPSPRASVYEVCHAGGAEHTLGLKRALGWNVCGDRLEAVDLTQAPAGLEMRGTAYNGTQVLFDYEVSGGQDSTLGFTGPLHVWHDTPDGIALLTIRLPSGPAKVYATTAAACTMAPGSILEGLLGATTCQESIVEGTWGGAFIQPPHDVDATFQYRPSLE